MQMITLTWEHVIDNSEFVQDINYHGTMTKEFVYEYDETEIYWYAYEGLLPNTPEEFHELGYTPYMIGEEHQSPYYWNDLFTISYTNIQQEPINGNVYFDLRIEYVGETIMWNPINDTANILSPTINDLDVSVKYENEEIFSETNLNLDEDEFIYIENLFIDLNSFEENVDIDIEIETSKEGRDFNQKLSYKFQTKRKEEYYVDLSTSSEEIIALPIAFENNVPSEFEYYTFTNITPKSSDYPVNFNDVAQIEYEGANNNTIGEITNSKIYLNKGMDEQYYPIELKYEDDKIIINQNFYYDYENEIVTNEPNSTTEEFTDSFIMPYDYEENYGYIDFDIEATGYYNTNFKVKVGFGNEYSLRGDDESKYKINISEINDKDYFMSRSEEWYKWN